MRIEMSDKPSIRERASHRVFEHEAETERLNQARWSYSVQLRVLE